MHNFLLGNGQFIIDKRMLSTKGKGKRGKGKGESTKYKGERGKGKGESIKGKVQRGKGKLFLPYNQFYQIVFLQPNIC